MNEGGAPGGPQPPAPVIDDRIAQRRREIRQARQRRRRRRTVTVLVVLVLLGVLLIIERSPLVGLEEVEVAGTVRLDPETVREAADLTLGTSTLRLRLGAVEDRVEALPQVREARAARTDPLTVRIQVVERTPALEVRGRGDPVLVDREGVVLDEGAQDGLPRIRIDGPPPAPGETVDADPALANAFAAWRGLSGPLRAQVVRLRTTGPSDLTLRLADGIEVRFGRAERIEEKVRALGAILEDVGDAEISAIDVRAPAAPFVVP